MGSVEIDDAEFQKLVSEIASKFPEYAMDSAEKALESAAQYLLGLLPEYPPEILDRVLPPDGGSWLRTDKQRRWFFATVRAGLLPGWQWTDGHPEKVGGARTGNLGRASGYDIERMASDNSGAPSVAAILGYDSAIAPYAPWVVGPDYPGEEIRGEEMYQARIHVDRWWQFESIILEGQEEAWKMFDKEFWELFSRKIFEMKFS